MASPRHDGRPPARSVPPRFYFWVDHSGTLGTILLRYDLRGRGVRRGARLGVDGRWHASGAPDQLMWLGTGSADPVEADEAARIAVALGHAEVDLTDPRVLP